MSTSTQTWAKCLYFAQPYDISAKGFYFADYDTYLARSSALRNAHGLPVEEFELQYIDGGAYRLFNAIGITQASLASWFELLEQLDDDEDRYLIACHLAEDGYQLEELAPQWDDYSVYRGTAAEYAEEMVADCYQLPDRLVYYLDYERLGRDMVLEGSIAKLERDLLLLGS